jgi:hypothetical protein
MEFIITTNISETVEEAFKPGNTLKLLLKKNFKPDNLLNESMFFFFWILQLWKLRQKVWKLKIMKKLSSYPEI